MPVNREFIDTNILVYAYDNDAGIKNRQAKQLLKRLWLTGTGCISVQVLQEFHNVITRRISIPLSKSQSASLIRSYAAWHVHSPTVADVAKAIELQDRYQTSFWDALILHSATQMNCTTVWSEDLNNGQFYGIVQVHNPFD